MQFLCRKGFLEKRQWGPKQSIVPCWNLAYYHTVQEKKNALTYCCTLFLPLWLELLKQFVPSLSKYLFKYALLRKLGRKLKENTKEFLNKSVLKSCLLQDKSGVITVNGVHKLCQLPQILIASKGKNTLAWCYWSKFHAFLG